MLDESPGDVLDQALESSECVLLNQLNMIHSNFALIKTREYNRILLDYLVIALHDILKLSLLNLQDVSKIFLKILHILIHFIEEFSDIFPHLLDELICAEDSF